MVATGLLLLMASVYLAARGIETRWAGAGYVRAFAEAAMVGGLADWFAVTALFRHPLGLPIPHTAIIPRNKDRIGDTLALFLRDNFLTASVVARRMRNIDIAAALGRWLTTPGGAGRLGAGATSMGLERSPADVRWGGSVSLILRTTGGSMVDDADRTNSPCCLRKSSSTLLSTPSSFASS